MNAAEDQTTANAIRRVAIFAHFDPSGHIDEYVLYYIRALKGLTRRIVFVSDGELGAEQAEKLVDLAEIAHASHHGEYDFGSWKRGFAHLDYDLSSWDEVIIANDSCFAPIFPFQDAFGTSEDCDFWGATKEPYNRIAKDWGLEPDERGFDFVNSYFMVFKKAVIDHPKFLEFWRGIAAQESKALVIEYYEVGLTRLLCGLGYRFKALTGREAVLFYPCNLPWARRMIFTKNGEGIEDLDQQLWRLNQYYPRLLIDNYVSRVLGFLPYQVPKAFASTLDDFPRLTWVPPGLILELAKLLSTIGCKALGSRLWNSATSRRIDAEADHALDQSRVLNALPLTAVFEIAKFSSTVGFKRFGSRIWNYAMARRASLDL